MDFLGARIRLNPQPKASQAAAFDVGLLGHCPGRVRVERLLALTSTLDEIRLAGYQERLAAIENDVINIEQARFEGLPKKEVEKRLDQLDLRVSHLPIPLYSSAEFDDIFPQSRDQITLYGSLLAGSRAWLPQAVDDFFSNGGQKLWMVRIPETEGLEGFLSQSPSSDSFSIAKPSLLDVNSLRGLACLLVIPKLALVAMPDLERLQIPAQLPDIPRMRLVNPEPTFLPLGSLYDDGHRERRYPSEIFNELPTQPTLDILRRFLSLTRLVRPDIQFLFTLPLSYSSSVASPAADAQTLSLLDQTRKTSGAHLLRQVQTLFPYLRQGERLYSGVGVVAGAISASATFRGAWRSVAMQPLITLAQPYPAMNTQTLLRLRASPGVGVLNLKAGQLKLDDERLMVPALHLGDYVLPNKNGNYSERLNGLRSAEVVRFLGYLVRELQALGEYLIFNDDPQDPRTQLVLEQFFTDLYKAGALRGRNSQEAFKIKRASAADNVIAFDIQIAPAFPIDSVVITFVNKDGQWQSGVGDA